VTDTPTPVRTADDERADVLAFLRYATKFPFSGDMNPADAIGVLHDLITRGEHAGWARKEDP
jgi:hypothetical protein